MSQVQIRQIPLATSPATQKIVGSWFPNCYYGHFRAKSRADLSNYFRQLARPEPPRKFLDRQHAEASVHPFSRHDNRFKFECDPLVRGTQEVFGKRRSSKNVRGEFDPFFVSWIPPTADPKTFVDDAKISSYADEYNHDTTSSRILTDLPSPTSPSQCTERPPTPSSPEVSVYSMAYAHGQPTRQQSKEIRRETFQRFVTSRTSRAEEQQNAKSASVASCLVWNNRPSEATRQPSVAEHRTESAVPVPTTVESPMVTKPVPPRPRAQSAGPRLTLTVTEPIPKPSVPMLRTMERPQTASTVSHEPYLRANAPPIRFLTPSRPASSFGPTPIHSMDSLIAKYM